MRAAASSPTEASVCDAVAAANALGVPDVAQAAAAANVKAAAPVVASTASIVAAAAAVDSPISDDNAEKKPAGRPRMNPWPGDRIMQGSRNLQ